MSFNSLNKLAHGVANSLALSVVARAVGGHAGHRRPIPERAAAEPPAGPGIAENTARPGRDYRPAGRRGRGTALAPSAALLDAVRPYVRRG